MIYYILSVFISAFLLFQIQPMIAKYILPWFGGTPAVWSTVQLFFQVFLTGGYAYAYFLIGRVRPTRQWKTHIILIVASLIQIVLLGILWPSPITPALSLRPLNVGYPIFYIFLLLLISVGLPYFVLASNGPIMQAWFSRMFPGKSPYRLYALSNFGSFLGLVSFPFIVEPAMVLREQGWLWAIFFVLFVLLVGFIAFISSRTNEVAVPSKGSSEVLDVNPPSRSTKSLWLILSAIASLMLLAVTSQITQEVAVIPFLWVIPLTVYLLSFVLAFSGERWYSRPVYSILMLLATIGFVWTLLSKTNNLILEVSIYSGLLFVICMVCHGELYRLRPHPSYLTNFYLLVSIGGALGGIFVNFISPVLFKGYLEFYLGLALVWVMLAVLTFIRPTVGLPPRNKFAIDVMIGSAAISVVLFSSFLIAAFYSGYLLTERNFYGVIRVAKINEDTPEFSAYTQMHGITMHGFQFISPEKREMPTTYFGDHSGIKVAILNHPKYRKGLRVGVLGLGAGTLAAYGQPGDVYRFYEINPLVVDLAEGKGGYFSFLRDSNADVSIVLGDARISLENELVSGSPQNFDLLVLDTFSGDAIPVHLVTEEAFALYLQHLAPDGILAAHITNRYLDLKPVLWQLAKHLNLSMVVIDNRINSKTEFSSRWILLSKDPSILQNPAILERAQSLDGYETSIRLWTDDYSNLFQILK
jgi:hypothetical protein